MPNTDRDEAIERVGTALYGELWIGELNTRDWEISRRLPPPSSAQPATLPSHGKDAVAIARAMFRAFASDLQFAQVFRWLNDSGIDCLVFDRSKFEAWFQSTFGEQSTTERRRAAVRELLKNGHRPGRGGNVTWKAFVCDVGIKTGLQFDLKTIQRDVEDLSTPN